MMNPVTKMSALSGSGAWGCGCGADGNDRYSGCSFLGLIPRYLVQGQVAFDAAFFHGGRWLTDFTDDTDEMGVGNDT